MVANKLAVKHARIVVIGVALMAASWVADAVLETLSGGHSFAEALLRPAGHDLVMRSLFLVVQLVFLLYLGRIMGKYRRQGELLEAALLSAETEKARSDAILEAVGDPISIQDPNYRILYQNEAHKELMGDHLGELCYEAYQDRKASCGGCHIALSLADGMTHKRESYARTKRGPMYLEIISTPLRDGTGKVVAGIEAVRDITERKSSEMEKARMNCELEQRARELSAANRELEAFNYSLSHDLRTYITRISTAEQILDQMPLEPETQFLVQSIAESCRGMDELIEAMLTLSQVSHKEMEWEEVDLSALALEATLHLQQQDPSRAVRLEISPGLCARGDRHLLKVALGNLLGNAWKYTRDVAQPWVAFGAAEREGRQVYCVRDNGVGFDMAEGELLFRPFQRLASARGFSGTGVGLATVQRVVQRHGGEVWGEGEPGKGATFYFSLP